MNLVEAWVKIYLEQKYKIQEMARTQRELVDKLDNKREIMYNHLIYCYLWTDTDDYNKWKGEVRTSINSTFSLKGKNKYPTEKQLWNWCMEDWVIEIKNRLDKIVDEAYIEERDNRQKLDLKGDLIKPEYNKQALTDYLISYIKWLNANICNGQQITRDEVSDKIDELIKQYK